MSDLEFGRYVVKIGTDIGMKPTDPFSGAYHVIDDTGAVMGTYFTLEFAISLAKGLEKSDQKDLSKEIEKMLRDPKLK